MKWTRYPAALLLALPTAAAAQQPPLSDPKGLSAQPPPLRGCQAKHWDGGYPRADRPVPSNQGA